MNALTLHLTNQLSTAGQVTPLIRTTGLQSTTETTVQLQEVQALQNLVRKLGVRNALIGVQALRNNLLLHHGAHAEMLTNIA